MSGIYEHCKNVQLHIVQSGNSPDAPHAVSDPKTIHFLLESFLPIADRSSVRAATKLCALLMHLLSNRIHPCIQGVYDIRIRYVIVDSVKLRVRLKREQILPRAKAVTVAVRPSNRYTRCFAWLKRCASNELHEIARDEHEVQQHVPHGFPWRHVTSEIQFPSVTVLRGILFSPVSAKCDGFRCVPYVYVVFAVQH